MKLILIAFLGLLPMLAQAVHKCTGPGGVVVYSDTPCANTHSNTKMEWEPNSNTNTLSMNGSGVPNIPEPDLTGDPALRLSKIMEALESMESGGLDCKIALQAKSKANATATQKCGPFVQQIKSWWGPVMKALGTLVSDPDAEALLPKIREATRVSQRVTDHSRFVEMKKDQLSDK